MDTSIVARAMQCLAVPHHGRAVAPRGRGCAYTRTRVSAHSIYDWPAWRDRLVCDGYHARGPGPPFDSAHPAVLAVLAELASGPGGALPASQQAAPGSAEQCCCRSLPAGPAVAVPADAGPWRGLGTRPGPWPCKGQARPRPGKARQPQSKGNASALALAPPRRAGPGTRALRPSAHFITLFS